MTSTVWSPYTKQNIQRIGMVQRRAARWLSNQPPYNKTNNVAVSQAKTQFSLDIHPVWSESSLSAWRKLGSLATHWVYSEDSDQTGRMTWFFAGRTATLLVLTWGSSNSYSSYDSVSAMLSNLGWCSLEYRRYDSHLEMFDKIQYGLVSVSMPSYFERPTGITRHMHSLCFRQPAVHVYVFVFWSNDCCFVEHAACRFGSLRRSWLLQERSEQVQLFRASVFISFLLTY